MHNVERNINIVLQRILETLKIKGKKYIFSYYSESDDILHAKSHKSKYVIDEIKKINAKAEKYSKLILEHENTMLIITAEHDHFIPNKKKIINHKITNCLRDNRFLSKIEHLLFLLNKEE